MENHLTVMDVGPGPGSAIDMLGDIGPHIHPFCALGFPLLNEGPLAILRTNDFLTLPEPSIELVPGELRTHRSVWVSPPHAWCLSRENKQQDQPQRIARGDEEERTRRTLLPKKISLGPVLFSGGGAHPVCYMSCTPFHSTLVNGVHHLSFWPPFYIHFPGPYMAHNQEIIQPPLLGPFTQA